MHPQAAMKGREFLFKNLPGNHGSWVMATWGLLAWEALCFGLFISGLKGVAATEPPQSTYTQEELLLEKQKTRERYEYKGLPVLSLTDEERVEFTRIWNEAMNRK